MGAQEQLADLWRSWSPRVMAYALRHVDHHEAEDLVSEAFLVAWRRLDDLPAEPLPWLIVVTRNLIANHRRTGHRRDRVEDDLRRLGTATHAALDVDPGDRQSALQALSSMTPDEREVLLLVAWDGLPPADAARVLGCSTGAFHVRVLRARRRLTALSNPPDYDDQADIAAKSLHPSPSRRTHVRPAIR